MPSVGGSEARAREPVRKLKKTFRGMRRSGIAQEQMRKTAQTFSRCSALVGALRASPRSASRRRAMPLRRPLAALRSSPSRHAHAAGASCSIPPPRPLPSARSQRRHRCMPHARRRGEHVPIRRTRHLCRPRSHCSGRDRRREMRCTRRPSAMRCDAHHRQKSDATSARVAASVPRHRLGRLQGQRTQRSARRAAVACARSISHGAPHASFATAPIRRLPRTSRAVIRHRPVPPPQTKTGRTRRPVRLSRRVGSAQWPSSSSSSA